MFSDHFAKLKCQVALEQAERKKRKFTVHATSFSSPSTGTKSSSSSRAHSVDKSPDSDSDSDVVWDPTNGAMHEIYVKTTRIRRVQRTQHSTGPRLERQKT